MAVYPASVAMLSIMIVKWSISKSNVHFGLELLFRSCRCRQFSNENLATIPDLA